MNRGMAHPAPSTDRAASPWDRPHRAGRTAAHAEETAPTVALSTRPASHVRHSPRICTLRQQQGGVVG